MKDIANQCRDRSDYLYRSGGGQKNEKGNWDCFHTDANLLSRAADEINTLRNVMCETAHRAATLGSGASGLLRGQFMSLSNALNAAVGRQQSLHGDHYDADGNVTPRT